LLQKKVGIYPLPAKYNCSVNSLDLNKTPSNSESHPELSCLTLRQHFHQFQAKLKYFDKMKQTRS